MTGPDILLLADRLSNEIKAAIDVPDAQTGNDLGIAERIAGSPAAMKLAVLGLNAGYLENDLSKAVEYWQQALELDPGFARVHMLMANAIFQLGNMEAASDAIRKALQHEYRLTDDDRFIAKALSYTWRNEPEKSLKLYEMWVELYPQNTRARKHLADAYISQTNQPRDALAQLEIVYKLDPDDDGVLLVMARIHEVLGELDEAIAKYTQYAENNPEDQTALIDMAATLINAGELQAAREGYERAGLFSSELVRPIIGLADIAIREGKYDEALKHLVDAENIARIPQQQARVIRGWINYYQARGQIGEILDLVDRLYEVGQAYMQPINLVMLTYVDYAYFYGLGAEVQRGIDVLTRLQAGFEPPLDTLVDVGFMLLWLADGNREKAGEYIEKVDAFLKLMQQEDLYYVSDMARARLAELDGNLDQAIEYDRKALERFSQSISGTQEEKDRMRINLSLARYLIQTGKLDEAQEILDGYLKGNPAHPIANLELARLEHARGNVQRAKDALRITLDAYAGADDAYPPAVEASRLARMLDQGL